MTSTRRLTGRIRVPLPPAEAFRLFDGMLVGGNRRVVPAPSMSEQAAQDLHLDRFRRPRR